MSSGVSHRMSCLSVHRTGKKLLLPDPMVFKAILSLQENLARIRRNCSKRTKWMKEFSDFFEDMNFIDLQLEDANYRCFTGDLHEAASRIDRMLISADCDDSFNNLKQIPSFGVAQWFGLETSMLEVSSLNPLASKSNTILDKRVWRSRIKIEGFSLRCLQSAGTFGQNMKRECEGERIPSQSLAQQDEPVQQMNSPEAGEEIPTRTLCKKTETYPRKMLLKGTTSTNPSKSASPTSATSANEDMTRADNQVAADDTPISTFDKDGVEGTVSPSLANARSKTSDVIEPPDCPVKFDNLEDFFARVNGQNKRAQSLGFSAVQSSPMDDKISATQKSTPSAEMLATVKCDVERLLMMSLQEMLLPENRSALSAALSVYAAAPDLSAERVLAMEKLKENLVPFSLTFQRAKKDQAEYYKKAAKKVSLVDELIKDQELCTKLKDCNDKLKDWTDKLEYKISGLEASLKDAKTKREAIQEQNLNLARRCSEKSSALDEMEVEFQVLKVMKELADSDTALLEECLKDFKSKIIG